MSGLPPGVLYSKIVLPIMKSIADSRKNREICGSPVEVDTLIASVFEETKVSQDWKLSLIGKGKENANR